MTEHVFQSVMGVCGLPHGFYVYNATSGELLAEMTPEDREVPLDELGLSAGEYELEVRYVDEWGTASTLGKATAKIKIDGGGSGAQTLAPATSIRAVAAAGGLIRLSFNVDLASLYAAPVEYELADVNHAATVISPVTVAGRNRIYELVGPFTHGQTVQLSIAASDGVIAGKRGAAVLAPPVVIDAQAPDGVTPIEPTLTCCCDD